MAEMQELIDKLKPEPAGGEGLGADLKRLAADPRYRGHLDVTVSVEGSGDLQPAEQSALLRIAQEALNNILKHARTNQATIRLGLGGDPWMEIEDRGQGFNPMQAQGMNRLGLTGMNERAAEIGWAFQIESSTGAGTRIRVEKT
jgi:signal transduction histidine kinase